MNTNYLFKITLGDLLYFTLLYFTTLLTNLIFEIMKKMMFLVGVLFVSTGVFASNEVEKEVKLDFAKVCCYKMVTIGQVGSNISAYGFGSGCAESTGNDYAAEDKNDACSIASANARVDARNNLQELTKSLQQN